MNSPQQILAKSRDFMESRILLTGAELDIYTMLANNPLSASELAEKTGYHQRPLTRLLDALSGMGVIVKKENQYLTEPSLAPLLSADSPDSLLPMLLHGASLWKQWSNLTEIIKETGKVDRFPAQFEEQEAMKAFIGAMHVIGSRQAAEIVDLVNPGNAEALLDVGGASGTYTIAFLEASPKLKATLFDRPEVVEMARQRLAENDLLDRAALAPGDFYTDRLPEGHDLAFVSAIIHQNSLEQNVELFRNIYTAIKVGGRIVIRDYIMSEDRTKPFAGAIFAINMLTATPGGGTWTFDEIKDSLHQVGFSGINLIQNDDTMNGLMEAFK